ncbi:MAG TPA: hypothetical protein VKQ29_09410 [Aliidongia sp.]|nr:hypothetical protein [Aliidongia sp.]
MIAKHRRRRAKEEAMIPAQKPDRPSALRPDKPRYGQKTGAGDRQQIGEDQPARISCGPMMDRCRSGIAHPVIQGDIKIHYRNTPILRQRRQLPGS